MTLLDTHALVWLAEGSTELGPSARVAADTALAGGTLAASAISFWETAMLQQEGRIEFSQNIGAWHKRLLTMGLVEIPVDGNIAIAAAALEDMHPDPADRLIVATAAQHGAVLVTADRRLLAGPVSIRVHDART